MPKSPMLAGLFDPKRAVYPLIATPKIDGVRIVARNGVAYTRSGKRLPNSAIQAYFRAHGLNGLDGELVVGSPRGKNSFALTQSGALSRGGRPDWRYTVFDRPDQRGGYAKRVATLPKARGRVVPIQTTWVKNARQLRRVEKKALALGFEGLVVRSPGGVYKHGRSTVREAGMLKIKPFKDAEARVLGVIEGKGRNRGAMGALKVKAGSARFHIGTGFSEAERLDMWRNRQKLVGQQVRFKYQQIGTKGAPRHPVFAGVRSTLDMSKVARVRSPRLKIGGKIGLLLTVGLLAYGLYKSTKKTSKPAQPKAGKTGLVKYHRNGKVFLRARPGQGR